MAIEQHLLSSRFCSHPQNTSLCHSGDWLTVLHQELAASWGNPLQIPPVPGYRLENILSHQSVSHAACVSLACLAQTGT